MSSESVDNAISRFSPLLLVLSLVLITAGAFLMLYFGYIVYILLSAPEQSHFMTYLLQQLPAPDQPIYTITGTSGGHPFEMNIPANLLVYGRYLLAFMIWSMIGNLVVQLIAAGLSIFRTLTRVTKNQNLTQKELHNADTRNSNYTR